MGKKQIDWTFLDHELIRDWAITVTIPYNKKVNFSGIYRAYNRFKKDQQKDILRYMLTQAIIYESEHVDIHPIELYFEEHKDGNIHAHGILKGYTLNEMKKINSEYNRKIGVKNDNVSHLLYKEHYSTGWNKYITKDQPADLTDLEKDLQELEEIEKKINNKLIVHF